jgi:hypothetical protein
MSLFPHEDILTKEIASWKGFADRLPDEDRKTFLKMLNDCYRYSKAINAKVCEQYRLIRLWFIDSNHIAYYNSCINYTFWFSFRTEQDINATYRNKEHGKKRHKYRTSPWSMG